MNKPTDLFDARREALTEKEAPLAARMRPRTLDEFVGQEHIVGPGRLLRRAIQADQLSSVIFYGPPGTGKTTLARIIANTTRAHFIAINAVLAGVAAIRDAVATAQERLGQFGQRTILFVDEVHRFNKAQQDALLPWVENGTVILIGATTENPYFEVNKALVSRSRIFQLKPLTEPDLYAIARQALTEPTRGYGRLNVIVDDNALAHLVDVANGDARGVLNALELAVETTPPGPDGVIHVGLVVAEESIQRRAVLYDKEGDVHYDTISAFIKSLRGSDPDAALYWMARMVYAGEDPRFIFRRMLIFAGEDVGLADPNAIRVVTACAQAFEYVGLPEGRFHLAEATLYLATAPKSNSTLAFFDALSAVERERETEVPNQLRDDNRDKEGFGHGEGYLYPHAYRDHWVAQQYLPDSLQGRVFYQPGGIGYEARIRGEVERRREAQLAAMLEGDAEGFGAVEILTFTGAAVSGDRDRWLQRAVSGAGERLSELRDRVLDAVRLQRHHLVLDLNAGSGLLTWEALRRVPEGGVWSLAFTGPEAAALRESAARLPELERPAILQGTLVELPELLAFRGNAEVRFDAVVGRGALGSARRSGAMPEMITAARLIAGLLRDGGAISLAEPVPRHTQRLYALVDLSSLGQELLAPARQRGLAEKLQAAEEAIYATPDDPLVNWAESDLRAAFVAADLAHVTVESQTTQTEARITPALLTRWFTPAAPGDRPSYSQRLAESLNADELAAVESLYRNTLTGRTVSWRTVTAYLLAR
ncbi:MAG: AAA family ATPase [Anaerolineae bacterium CG2_30_64_16]|nr:MAG: AAA family ATPase [Anaerolineae bacterium CG2_30_64_16]